jgi:hypothetical protein
MKEALKYLQAGAIVPVDMETTLLLVNALKEVLEQPAQQEPVGKFAKFTNGIWREVTDGSPGVSLYTAPLQRPWVGIPEEDLKQGDESFFVAWREGARWADAYLKEKNNG